jgi:uncharacterized protein
MKRIRFVCFLVLFLGYFESIANAQPDNKIASLALVKKDSVVLRWVPASIPVWQLGIKYGYVIRRFTIARGGVFIQDGLSKSEILTPDPIRPSQYEEFDILAHSQPLATVVQEAIYGNELLQPGEGRKFNSFLKAYNEMEVRFGFALFICDYSPEIAKAAGLQFTDRSILPDERYAYSISLANVPDEMQVDPEVIVVDAGRVTKLPAVNNVEAIFLDKSVRFQWPIVLHRNTFTAYILEKSIDGINYLSVSSLPLVNLSEDVDPNYFVYTDSLKTNNQETWYRVKGMSPFGEEGPPSDVVKGKGEPEFNVYAVIDTIEITGNKSSRIRWRVNESEQGQVKGISILRSDKPDGVFDNLTPKPITPDLRVFTDQNPRLSNYYKILLHGKDDLTSCSFPYFSQIEDNDPPAPPRMITGKVDSLGIVTLVWKDNNEPDILGYKVFRANAPGDDFISLDRELSAKNICSDTINLNTLAKKIYYQVVAIDKSYNTSDYSAILELSRPDTVCPAPALITRIKVLDGKVTIFLEGSPADDIRLYEMYRSTYSDSTSELLAVLKGPLPVAYIDMPSVKGRKYYYFIKTLDFAGNSSENGRYVYIPAASHSLVSLTARQEKNGKSITLSWDLPEDLKPLKTIIYRGKENAPICTYKTIEGNLQLFKDEDIEINTLYNYRIKIFSKGNEVAYSEAITFKPLLNSFQETK